MQAIRIVVSAVAVLFASAAARAGPVTWYFAGNVTEVHDEYNLLGGSVHVGTPFSGEFNFESTTPDSEPEDPTSGSYEYALLSLSGQVGDFEFSFDPTWWSSIQVLNDERATGFDAYSLLTGVRILDTSIMSFGLVLIDMEGLALSSDELPLGTPDLNAFETRHFGMGSQSSGVAIDGVLTSFVPDPGTVILLLAGSGAIMSRRRRLTRIVDRKPTSPVPATPLVVVLVTLLCAGTIPAASAQEPSCGCMDLVFLIDVTQSMENALPQVSAQLTTVVATARTASGGDLRLGLITFADVVIVDAPLTTEVDRVLDQLDDLTISLYGANTPEPSDEALREMVSGTVCDSQCDFSIPWRTECIKHAILITDILPAGCDDDFDDPGDEINADIRAREAAVAAP